MIPRSAFRLAASLFAAAMLAIVATPAAPQQSKPVQGSEDLASPFDADEKAAIREEVRRYILENPEIIVEAVEILRQRQRQEAQARRQGAIEAHRAALVDAGRLPVFGNPDGDVTVVEFFDYRCPYCRRVAPDLFKAVESDGNVRLILKEYPILGEESVFAARAAVAATAQDAYGEFHRKLIGEVKRVNRDSVLKLAERIGLDVARLKQDMRAEWVDQEIARARQLARALEINGTPAFVVGSELVPGAVSLQRLKDLIAQARRGEG